MSDELKPCPFCGNDDTEHLRQSAFTGAMFCEACGAEGPWSPAFNGDWNTRAVDPAAIRKAALQEAAEKVKTFTDAMLSIKHQQDEGERLVLAASAMLNGARAAILALIEKDAGNETA